ncbi:MAG: glycosyltransferase family 2 protein [Longimicrobiales bacterium]
MRFILPVTLYNMSRWIGGTIESIRKQTHADFRCLIGDDLSTDDGAAVARRTIDGDGRFEVITHVEKMHSLGNIATLIELARPADDDVIVLVDGDDYLAHENVLKTLADIYNRQGCWLTYGSFRRTDRTEKDAVCREYSPRTIAKARYRRVDWRASHLKTFLYKLWRRIRPDAFTVTEAELARAVRRALLTGRIRYWLNWRKIRLADLLDSTGRFVRRPSDKAIMYPVLEMAGPKAFFVEEILYLYNRYPQDPLFPVSKPEQKWHKRCLPDILEHKPRYARLTGL